MRKDDAATCFQVTTPDGRRSSVWRVWSSGDDVYLSPGAKRSEFKISLHQSGDWRIAFDLKYAGVLKKLGTWSGNRCYEQIRRPTGGHDVGFTRGTRIFFASSELRSIAEQWVPTNGEVIQNVPAPPAGDVRVVDLVYTNAQSPLTEVEWLRSWQAQKIANWRLRNGETVWLVHFCWSAATESVEREAEWFRMNLHQARKLDNRADINSSSIQSRIMIAGVNKDMWFSVIDAAAS